MRKLLSIFISIVFMFIFCASSTTAMTCSPIPFDEAIQQADVIFKGTVIDREPLSNRSNGLCWEQSEGYYSDCGSKIATFDVHQLWKGDVDSSVKVFSEDACYCLGNYFKMGSELIVFARLEDVHNADLIAQDVCHGTSMINSDSSELIENLNEAFF